ncbi:MAG: amidase [Solirubrobacterales bacterium]
MSAELASLDATAQAELVRAGEASPTELVEAAISRTEAIDPQLNAVIHPLFDEAREAAAGELPEGPFRGVPFMLKDLGAAFAGQPLHLGMRYLKDLGFRAPVDTYLAQRFRAAGFVTIGKTNTPELGILPTAEPIAYGPSRNPWDTGRSTGGSSGGSAAAVASGMVPVAHANDGGGSIRVPASECGLVGLKPTRQRTSEGPLIGDVMSGLTVEHVVSKSVRDAAAILDAVHGPAPGDPYVAPPPARPYAEELTADPGRLRIAVITDPLTDVSVDDAVVGAAGEVAETLESLGHSLESPDVSAFTGFDLVETFITRWAAGQAATLAQLGAIGGRPIAEGDVEPLTWALAERGRSDSAGDYLGAVSAHQALARMFAGIHEAGIDLLLTPTLGELPPALGSFDDSGPDPMTALFRASKTCAFTAAFNVTGQPAISLPLCVSEEGLPVGVQLVAAFGREDLLIRIAAQLEQARPWADRRPGVFAEPAEPSP